MADIVEVVSEADAGIKGVDVADFEGNQMRVDITLDLKDSNHRRRVRKLLEAAEGVRVERISDQTFLDHIGGKIKVEPRVPLRDRDDLSRVYTPGVARVCEAIHDIPAKARLLTMKANTVAVVTDGTAVLGLGDIGPAAALPVMEGKAVLFKHFGRVDAWPVVLDTKDTEEIISIVKAIAPAYGGINLEDISAPRCFEIERRLKEELDIPVFHDDQHGTAIVVMAALHNALKVVGKNMEDVKIVVAGVGAAGSAIMRMLLGSGATDIVGYDRQGALHLGRDLQAMDPDRRWLAENTNVHQRTGSLKEGLEGADVFIGVSHGGILRGEDVSAMADDAVVFALANPLPEVDPIAARKHAKVVATGRSDYPNQINNVLAFPGLFRGVLDAHATEITMEAMLAAAKAIADVIAPDELSATYIVPGVFDRRVAPAVSHATRKALVGAPTAAIVEQEDANLEQDETFL